MSDDLRTLFEDAVSDVEPADRLAAIHARTMPRRSRRSPRGWYVGGGAVLATAAAVTAIAVVATSGHDAAEPVPATPSSPTASDSADPTPSRTGAPADHAETLALYFVGDTDGARRVFREFRRVPVDGPSAQDLVDATVAALEAGPDDPDYRYPWPRGAYNARMSGGVLHVAVSAAPAGGWDDPVARQQLYRSLAAAVPGTEIVFNYDDGATFRVEPDFDLMSHLSISDPAEGTEVSEHFTARGVSNGFEANVACQLIGADGPSAGKVFGPFVTTAKGWTEPRLFPWTMDVDLSEVVPGTYTFSCATDDPSGGAEGGRGADVDTRTVIVG